MKIFPLIIFSCLLYLEMSGQDFPIPNNYIIIDSISGDLDSDGVNELVVAFNLRREIEDTFENVPREIIIYKQKNKIWTIWKRSKQVLYGSHDGGMMGDPFGEIQVKNGELLVSQSGGSSWKWEHKDTYRFLNGELYLSNFTSLYGKQCNYWTDVAFNIITGELIVKKEYQQCADEEDEENIVYKTENETIFKKGLKITFENRSQPEIIIITEKYGHVIYISNN